MFLPEIRLASSFGRARGGYNFVENMQLPYDEVAVHNGLLAFLKLVARAVICKPRVRKCRNAI